MGKPQLGDLMSEKYAEIFNGVSEPEKLGYSSIIPNLITGASWAFFTESQLSGGIRESFEGLRNHPQFKITTISQGVYILEVEFIETLKKAAQALPAVYTPDALKLAIQNRDYGRRNFDAFLNRLQQPATIGIANLNDSNTITRNGTTYPAFTVSPDDVDKIVSSKKRDNRHLVLGNPYLAPSGNALFVNVSVRGL